MSLVIDEHRRYLADHWRVERYARALAEVVRAGDTVVDLASGTGILGLLACRAGAARVIAIEAEPIAGLARAIARANGLDDRVEVLRAHSTDARLSTPADLAVTDQIGRFGFEAGLLRVLADAWRRLLKPGARTIPAAFTLETAPVEHERLFARVDFWRRQPAGFHFDPVYALAANTGYPARFAPESLLADPQQPCRIDLSQPAPPTLAIDATFTVNRSGTLHGIGGWFRAELSPSVVMSNSPLDPQRIRRRQVFFPVEQPVSVAGGDRVDLSMRMLPDEVVVSWRVTVIDRSGSARSFAQSTMKGMLIDAADLRMMDPAYRPVLTDRGAARRTVLELCDGALTLAEIEAEVYARHEPLFASAAEAAMFVGEVVTRYSRAAP